MPARRLGAEPLPVEKFDVLGLDAQNSPEFIGHVGLAEHENSRVSVGLAFAMVHMGPPLGTGVPPGTLTSIGTVSLTADEILQIRLFVDNLEGEYKAANVRDASGQYCIAPHVRPRVSNDRTVICFQFNCGGFVLESYRFANIDLLQTDPAMLPPVPLDVLIRQYPTFEQVLRYPRFRERMGIPGDGPWPVVLAGYVINALNRPEPEIRAIPYRANEGDEFFPTRVPID
jgi:hypothetical protein